MKNSTNAILPLLTIASHAMTLGRVERATWHPDGHSESDTTHTCMLGLIAIGLQPHAGVALDAGLLAQLAYVHDYPEIYAGDTNTAGGLTDAQRAAKDAREAVALERIYSELRDLPALAAMVQMYEAQECAEARWLRYLDKIMPKLTHWWNRCAAVIELGMSLEDVKATHARQGAELRARYPEFTMLHDLFRMACVACEAVYDDDVFQPEAWTAAHNVLLAELRAANDEPFRQQRQQEPMPDGSRGRN